ncbi:MAG: 3-oxoacyl-ACP synthase [Cyclobacteriaceae bacterium]
MSLKSKVYQKCLEEVSGKISLIQKAMKDAQESANSEEKSTAGDKHDTARAMSHIERDMYAKQLTEAYALKKTLDAIDSTKTCESVETGALARTTSGTFFISCALGKIDIEGKTVFAISPISPMGKALLGKSKENAVEFQGRKIDILEVS